MSWTSSILGPLEHEAKLPALDFLRPLVHLRGHDGWPAAWLNTIADLLQEMTAGSPGSEAVAVRLIDLFLAQALRAVEAGLLGRTPLADREIATALRLIHDQPDHRVTINRITS